MTLIQTYKSVPVTLEKVCELPPTFDEDTAFGKIVTGREKALAGILVMLEGEEAPNDSAFAYKTKMTFYDLTTGREEFTLPQSLRGITFDSGDKTLGWGEDGKTIYDLETGKVQSIFPQKCFECFYASTITNDGKRLVMEAEDYQVIYDVESGEEKFRLPEKGNGIIHNIRGRLLALLADERTLYDLDKGEKAFTMPEPVGELVIELKDGRTLIQGSLNWKIKDNHKTFYDLDTKTKAYTLPGYINPFLYNLDGGKCLGLEFPGSRNTFYDMETGKVAFCLPQKVNGFQIPVRKHAVILGEDSQTFYDLNAGGKETFHFPEPCLDFYHYHTQEISSERDKRKFFLSRDHRTLYDLVQQEALELPFEICQEAAQTKDGLFVIGADNRTVYRVG